MSNNHTFIDSSNLLQQREQERQLEKHRKKLEEIAKRKYKVKQQEDVEIVHRINENKRQIHEFQLNRKKEWIDKENQLLLQKLVEIQSGKRSILPKSASQVSLTEVRAKSLHHAYRKQELERIERENMKIAQKIYQLKPKIKAKQLEEEFVLHQKYSKSIRRLKQKQQPKHQGKMGALPPLSRSISPGNQRKQSNENKSIALGSKDFDFQTQTNKDQTIKSQIQTARTKNVVDMNFEKMISRPNNLQRSFEQYKVISKSPYHKKILSQIDKPILKQKSKKSIGKQRSTNNQAKVSEQEIKQSNDQGVQEIEEKDNEKKNEYKSVEKEEEKYSQYSDD